RYTTGSSGVNSFCGQTAPSVKNRRSLFWITRRRMFASSYVHHNRVTFRYSSTIRMTIAIAASASRPVRLRSFMDGALPYRDFYYPLNALLHILTLENEGVE